MFGNITTAAALIFFLGITILIHEFGHYIAARRLGLVVETFSIGFGPALWKKEINGIVYRIGWIPFGGYVALPQLDPAAMGRLQLSEKKEKTPPDDSEADAPATEEKKPPLPLISPWKKIAVALAGAAGNILMAVILAWVVYAVGMPAGPAERDPTVGYVDDEGEAYRQGLRVGDRVLSVNGKDVGSWREVQNEAVIETEVTLEVAAPDGTAKTIRLATEPGEMGGRRIPGVGGIELCLTLRTRPGTTAEAAGILPGDIFVEMAGQPVTSIPQLNEIVNAHRDREVDVVVLRGDQRVTMKVTPQYDEELERALIGVEFNPRAVDFDTVVRPLPSEQLKHHASAVFRVLHALTTPGRAKVAQGAVSGPVGLILGYWQIVQVSFMLAVWFTGFLNVNLAIINLLPIPVLDGGHIVFALWEGVTRRPVKVWVVEGLVNVCMVLLLALFVFLSVRDVDRVADLGTRVKNLFRQQENVATLEATGLPPAEGTQTNQPPAPERETNEGRGMSDKEDAGERSSGAAQE